MKQCPYCGKDYPDTESLCAIDQSRLEPVCPVGGPQGIHVKEECQGEDLIAVCDAIAKVNLGCSDRTFGVDRAVKAEFRGRDVCFVVADIGASALVAPASFRAGRSRWRSVYALAESQEQATWMASHADVFTPVSNDSAPPLFWVKHGEVRSMITKGIGRNS